MDHVQIPFAGRVSFFSPQALLVARSCRCHSLRCLLFHGCFKLLHLHSHLHLFTSGPLPITRYLPIEGGD